MLELDELQALVGTEDIEVRDVDRPRTAASAGGIDVFSPDEVIALVRAAVGRAGRRALPHRGLHGPAAGGLVALRWRDVDFPG